MLIKHTFLLLIMFVYLYISASLPVYAVQRQEINQEIRESIKDKAAPRASVIKNLKGLKLVISGGLITGINGTTLTVEKEGKTYTVLTDDKTQLRRKFWGKSSISEMSVGDKINLRGEWTDENQTQVKARFIRDLSIQMRHGVFFGIVKSSLDSGFVIDTIKRGTLTVTVKPDTKYVNRKEETITLADVKVGHRIRIRGLWNSQKGTLADTEAVKDFSLPERPGVSAGPSLSPNASSSASASPITQ